MWNLEHTYTGNDPTIIGYSDADHTSQVHQHSILGYTFHIGGGAVTWSSKKQPVVALSTTEAKYVAAAHTMKEAVWLRALAGSLTSPLTALTVLHCDNQSAIVLSKNGQHHARMKHIDVWFHFVREAVENGSISLAYCPTGLMMADLLTKPLNHSKTGEHAAGLGLLLA